MANETKARTQPVRAKILTDQYEIEGNIHVKMDELHGRVSQILDAPDIEFVPVTQATCTSRTAPESEPVHTDCTIIQVKTIRMVFPFED
jgi:hypothetical protein